MVPASRAGFVRPAAWRAVPADPFETALRRQCERIIAGSACPQLQIQLDLVVEGLCPAHQQRVVLRTVDELVTNAMEHAFYSRVRGRIFVWVASQSAGGTEVSVSDDGWGFDRGDLVDGNGFRLLRSLGALYLTAAAGPFVASTGVTLIIPPRIDRHIAPTAVAANG